MALSVNESPFFVKFLNSSFQTDSHPCIRIGGPVDCIGGPVDSWTPKSASVPPHMQIIPRISDSWPKTGSNKAQNGV